MTSPHCADNVSKCMHKKSLLVLIAVLCLCGGSSAAAGETYFSFTIESRIELETLTRILSIDTRRAEAHPGVHAVAYKKNKGREWYLIKDSNRSSRLGRYEGYYMWDGDYIRLKMLAFLVHRDRLAGLLPEG